MGLAGGKGLVVFGEVVVVGENAQVEADKQLDLVAGAEEGRGAEAEAGTDLQDAAGAAMVGQGRQAGVIGGGGGLGVVLPGVALEEA